LGFVEIGMELETIESTIQLSSFKNHSKSLIHGSNTSIQDHKNLSNSSISDGSICCSSSQNPKRIPRIIGKRGTRNTEFLHPSSLAYSKRDQLICKFPKLLFLSIIYF
jgi:hypothetical protein